LSDRRVLIVGAKGQVGTELRRTFQGFGHVIAVDRESVDLANPVETRALVSKAAPDVILNAAAYTAVDRAESEPESAMAINADAPRVLAEEAERRGAILVHYSTDYVFDGSKREPWLETDVPCPLNVYGKSKLAGEKAIQEVGGKYLIFRTSWVYGPHGSNFLLTMLRLGGERELLSVVDDQIGAPTTSIVLADATRKIVEGVTAGSLGNTQDWAGLYHMTCGESVSWYGFAEAIFIRARNQFRTKIPIITPISSHEYPVAAHRPLYSVLCNDRLRVRLGVQLPSWAAALDEVFGLLESAVTLTSPARREHC
jgi:dTDP-4-dehydrorhamnose reductase